MMGVNREQGPRFPSREPGAGRLGKEGMAESREMQTCQTVEVSWEPGPFQPEIEGLPWRSSG